jgi:hypothetical protein
MNNIEKRDFIHSHLHQLNEELVSELYQRMYSFMKDENPVVGYNLSGRAIRKKQFVSDLKVAEKQIERGEYTTIEDLEKESEQW